MVTVMVSPQERDRLKTFLEDRDRARVRVAILEAQAAAFTAEGKTVPAGALMRRIRIIRHLWCLTPCDDVNDEQSGAFNDITGEGR